MTRRAFLLGFAPGSAAAAYARFRYVEPEWFELTHTRVALPGARPKRILQVSDIHMSDGMSAAELETGLRVGLEQRPDIICFTGDFVTTTVGFDRAGLQRMLRRAANTAPCYAVMGNHDGGDWLRHHGGSASTAMIRELVGSTGVRMLHNRAAIEQGIRLVGVGDFWSGEFAPERAFEACDTAVPTLVLCHNPDAKQSLLPWRWDLMLSGHTHGGQVRIPAVNPLWTPVWDKRFVAGLYRWEGRQLFITRGLGSPKHVRAFCRPEISMLHVTTSRDRKGAVGS
jgi:predicted MPP superfamily phosphohydrolase